MARVQYFVLQDTDDYYYDYENGDGNYLDNPDQDGSGPPPNFEKCYNSYGTQKTLRYSKVSVYIYLSKISTVLAD